MAADFIAQADLSVPASTPAAIPPRSRTQAFLHGAGTGYLYQALVMLLGLLLTPFYLRHLGQSDYGLWLVGTQLFGYLTLLDLGVTALLPRETAYVTGRMRAAAGSGNSSEHGELAELAGRVLRIALWQAPIMALAAALLWRLNPAAWSQLRGPLGIALAGIVLLFPTRVFHALLIGLQDFAFTNLAQAAGYAVTAAASVLLVLRGWGLYAIAIGFTVGQGVAAVLWIARVARRHRYAFPQWAQLQWASARHYLGRSTWLTVAKVADALLSGSDMLIVGKVLGPAAVVPYACTGKLLLVFSNQPVMVAGLALPGLSEMKYAEGRERLLQAVTAVTQGMLLMTGLLVTVMLLVNRAFVGWWVGTQYFAGMALTVALVAAVLLRHFSIALAGSVFCFGYERRFALQGAADGVLSACLAILLTRRFGLIGVPIGNMCGVLLITLPGCFVVLRRELRISLGKLLAPFVPWAARLIVLLLGAWYFSRLPKLNGFLALAAATLACALVYALVMWSIARRPPLGQYTDRLIQPLAAFFGKHRPGKAMEQSSGR